MSCGWGARESWPFIGSSFGAIPHSPNLCWDRHAMPVGVGIGVTVALGGCWVLFFFWVGQGYSLFYGRLVCFKRLFEDREQWQKDWIADDYHLLDMFLLATAPSPPWFPRARSLRTA
ncbi:hypothetical protein BDW66DRAFT_92587 [Aspergillus desertorum]